MQTRKKGFTLIEFIFSVTIMLSISLALLGIMRFTTDSAVKFYENMEAFENVRLGMDFLEMQIRNAERLKLKNIKGTDTLDTLDVYFDGEESKFIYNRYINEDNVRYKRLEFGGNSNELVKNIDELNIILDPETESMYIFISSNDISLERYLDISGKEIL